MTIWYNYVIKGSWIVVKKELKEEIEQNKNLGRSQRRKKERELQKKYKNKDIRIKSGKTFTKSEGITRKQQRKIMKDKDFLKEIIKIIHKYFPELTTLFSKLTDKRHKSYITYKMRTIIVTRVIALLCGITTMTEINSKFKSDEAIQNLSAICNQKLDEIPDWQTIQDVIETLDYNKIDDIRKYMFKALLRSKMFDKFKFNNCIQLIVDATGLTSLDYNLNGNCLSKTRDGKTKYYKYVLEAKVVFFNMVISIDSEWIENNELNNEKQKQDCEVNAFKRLAPRIKKNYPKLKFIITGDALYATTPMINICKEFNWHYIFNLKKDRLKNVYEEFEDNINYENEVVKENYYLSSNILFKGNFLNAFRYVETKKNKTIVFNYVSDLKVSNDNIKEIVEMGRRRWKIENEGFNLQKNGTFKISHLCSHFDNALKIHYLFIQIAHTIRQLLELGSLVFKEVKKFVTKKEISQLIINTLISSTITNLESLDLNFQLRFDDWIITNNLFFEN